MSYGFEEQERDQNTAELVMNTFYRVARKDGVTASDIAKYLQDRYGDVWRISTLLRKAEGTLKRSAELGFLDRRGNRYVTSLVREMRCRRKRRRCCCKPRRRRRKRSCGRKRRRRRCSCR